jgi:hypothetical protein
VLGIAKYGELLQKRKGGAMSMCQEIESTTLHGDSVIVADMTYSQEVLQEASKEGGALHRT